MMRSTWKTLSGISCLALAAGVAVSQQKPAPDTHKTPKLLFCADPSQPDRLCSFMPIDISAGINGYSTFTDTGQMPFDNFSFQSLVALNWPANPDGTPSDLPFNSPMALPRVWDFYKTVDQVYPASGVPDPAYPSAPAVPPECGSGVGAAAFPRSFRVVRMMTKADDAFTPGNNLEAAVNIPLLDRNLNYTVYEILVNRDEFEYVLQNQLYSPKGQMGIPFINFPSGKSSGTATSGGYASSGAIEVKAAWRILDPSKGDIVSHYFTRQSRIYVPAANSDSGKSFCTAPVTLGLVGIHILHKTAANPLWVWSTFEQNDNAPTTTTPEGQPGCAVPPIDARRRYSYFNPLCWDPSTGKACVANRPPSAMQGSNFTWASGAPVNGPYAQKFATDGKFGTQVVRCQPVYSEANDMTRRWSTVLAGTVWQYYHLVGTQWQTAGDPPRPPINTIPTYVLNTTLETYLQKSGNQTVPQSACIQCHNYAFDATGRKPAKPC
ncbi:MAG TPA: hypothetical protein VNV86_22700, partial [Candidatus Acidoferrum sp.]|nr:hypothetical protein [Candidatus Acidoferrum sp.]